MQYIRMAEPFLKLKNNKVIISNPGTYVPLRSKNNKVLNHLEIQYIKLGKKVLSSYLDKVIANHKAVKVLLLNDDILDDYYKGVIQRTQYLLLQYSKELNRRKVYKIK